jgi:hypothetical protein
MTDAQASMRRAAVECIKTSKSAEIKNPKENDYCTYNKAHLPPVKSFKNITLFSLSLPSVIYTIAL